VYATLFRAETDDVTSEGTNGLTNSARVREYEAQGLEVEGVANIDALSLFGSFTWTDAEIVSSNDVSLEGNKPRRQADFVYSGGAVYNWDGGHSTGLSMVGTSDSYAQDANDYKLDAYYYFNAFATYRLSEGLTATLAINNLTDELGMTEAEENTPVNINGSEYVRGRSIAGRSSSISLKYQF
jgi:outer membrane receptor protein involved in Fe transport